MPFPKEKEDCYGKTAVPLCTDAFEENLYRLKLNIRSGVRQLSSEFLAMEHDPQNAERVRDLIDYMRQVISELEQFTYHDRADS